MTITGFPFIIFLNLIEFVPMSVIKKCAINTTNNGTIPYKIGIEISCIGVQASSAIASVITNSNGCNSPSCLFPISRIPTTRNKNIINVLIIITNILLVCMKQIHLCKKRRNRRFYIFNNFLFRSVYCYLFNLIEFNVNNVFNVIVTHIISFRTIEMHSIIIGKHATIFFYVNFNFNICIIQGDIV